MSIFDVQVPSWLTEIAKPIDAKLTGHVLGTLLGGAANAVDEGTSFGQGIAEGRMAQADPMWRLHAAQQQAATMGHMAQAQAEFALANQRKYDLSSIINDVPKAPAWLAATPEQRAQMPDPGFASKEMLILSQKTRASDNIYFARKQAAENSSLANKIALKDSADFTKRLGDLPGTDGATARAGIGNMQRNPDGTPSEMQFQALGLAEQAAQQAKENAAAQAQLDAQKSGALKTTTITGDKITNKYTPPELARGRLSTPERLDNYRDRLKAAGDLQGAAFIDEYKGKLAHGLTEVGLENKLKWSIMNARGMRAAASVGPEAAKEVPQWDAKIKSLNGILQEMQTERASRAASAAAVGAGAAPAPVVPQATPTDEDTSDEEDSDPMNLY